MRMVQWICGHTRRDRVWNDDIRERQGVAPVEKKFMQHRLRWFEHMQLRPTKAPICNGVIRRTSNKKRGKARPNLTCEESVKRDLKDWYISKELALDRREWKLAIHMPESWSLVPSFYNLLSSFFSCPFFGFLTWRFIVFSLFSIWFFYHPLFSPYFFLLFCTCFFFSCGFISNLPQLA
jgi:hypothetical protein